MSWDFWHFFIKKNLHLRPIGTGKNDFAKFFIFAKIFAKNVCPCSQRLSWYGVSVVNDYADTMSVWSTTTLTLFQHSQRLHGHRVSIVNDYADTVSVKIVVDYANMMLASDKTTQTLSNFIEGFSQILKELSGEKGTWVCLQPQKQ